jgi:hypothetical protein
LSVSTSKKTYLWGEPVDVFARLVDEELRPLDGALLQGDVLNQATGSTSGPFTMAEKGGGSHLSRIDFLAPGRYRATVTARLGDAEYGEETVDFTIDRRGLEDFEFRGDAELLRRLAALTGGSYRSAAEAADMVAEINPGMVIVKSFHELRLPLSLPVFLAVAGLLGVEWLMRKRRMLL